MIILLETINEAFYAICIIFIICEFGERLTIAYDEMNCQIEQFDWYLFPIEIKRLLPILMIDAQQRVELQCFGTLSASRESLKKVYAQFD